ncbi:hypothetical protein ACIRL2_50045 [Embleya sp. NPDC127516]|uniref:hypothetical protein n=1 Tax=Embleya sp. NPDC127516 TaxID=3363990 RepID=UPI00380BAB17
MLTSRMETVDWAAIPTPFGPTARLGGADGHARYELLDPAQGLRALASATNLSQAAEAASHLSNSTLPHSHMSAVFPAAVVAAPFLPDIAEHGRPQARQAAVTLLREMTCSTPIPGFDRVRTAAGHHAPLCCAVAEVVRGRREVLVALGRSGGDLLGSAAAHWRFDVCEAVAAEGGTVAFGILDGVLPAEPPRGELHLAGVRVSITSVVVEYPPVEECGDACVRLVGAPIGESVDGGVVRPAECGERGR